MDENDFEDVLEWSNIEQDVAFQLRDEANERVDNWNVRIREGLWMYQLYGHTTPAETVLIPRGLLPWIADRRLHARVVSHHSDLAPSVSGKDRNAIVFRWQIHAEEEYRATYGPF